jgi:hypothetical protein
MHCPICAEDLGAVADDQGPPVLLPIECPRCGPSLVIRSGPGLPLSIAVGRSSRGKPKDVIVSDRPGFGDSIERPEDRR